MVSTGSGISLLILTLIIIGLDSSINMYFFLLIAIITMIPILVQIGFEKKYAKNPNEYLLTILGMAITVVIMGTLLFILSPRF
ncbi:DUF4181 domain-containing protein [Planococcus donghaensis]|uniref:DUF4181 domain-containing protein n=1 Tax=Planococcus donghaensis TaxID=414778 RepID=UPI001ED976FB|nr:DUF4181 domain-containing protein [Planococcus donghaensis]